MFDLPVLLDLRTARALEQQREDLKTALENENGVAMVMPAGFELQDLEHLMPTRRNFRGVFDTKDIDSFVKHTNQHHLADDDNGPNTAAIFIDQDKMQARAIYDLGSRSEPLHCRNRGQLTMEMMPEFAALATITGFTGSSPRVVTQREFAEFFEDWGDFYSFEDEDNMTIRKEEVIKAIRNVKVTEDIRSESTVNHLSAGSSVSEQVKAAGKDSNKLPVFIKFTSNNYDGLDEYTIDLRSVINAGRGEANFKLLMRRPGQVRRDIAFNFSSVLRNKLKDGGCSEIPTTLGSFAKND